MANTQPQVAEMSHVVVTADGARSEAERLAAVGKQLREARRSADAAQIYDQISRLLPRDWLAAHNAGAVFLEAGRLVEARQAFERSVALRPSVDGFALYAHALALLGDMRASQRAYLEAVRLVPDHFDANWGLFEVEQLLGNNTAALRHQQIALAQRSLVSIPARRSPPKLTILELCIAGTFQANIPLDFILKTDEVSVHKMYLGDYPAPALPAYDLVFNTIADAPNAGPALAAAQALILGQRRPSLNAPQLVPLTARERIAERFARSQNVAVAATVHVTRQAVIAEHPAFPFLIRPLDSHAGNDLAKIDNEVALIAYLAETPYTDDFYLSDFIDYRSPDGYFRKYRIVYVDGVAYPVHLAISPRWMIHYYNAPMAENEWMRDEEHTFMRDMDAVFSGSLALGLSEIFEALPLEYFGIDCSITADGRVLLFEASTAMIVHMRDSADLYPYKREYVPRIINALHTLLVDRAAQSVST